MPSEEKKVARNILKRVHENGLTPCSPSLSSLMVVIGSHESDVSYFFPEKVSKLKRKQSIPTITICDRPRDNGMAGSRESDLES